MRFYCQQCGKEFEDLTYKKNRKYCSRECVVESQKREVTQPCAFCGKSITDRKSRFERANRVFCNGKCMHSWQSKEKIQFPELRDKNWCQEQYKTKPLSEIAKDLGCGETTVYKYFKRHNISLTKRYKASLSAAMLKNDSNLGENNPNWKGGISRITIRIRSLSEYSTWRKAVMDSQENKCAFCKATSDLEVDHIKQFRFIVSDNNIKSIEDAKGCKELWDVKNGRILCKRCNRKREIMD